MRKIKNNVVRRAFRGKFNESLALHQVNKIMLGNRTLTPSVVNAYEMEAPNRYDQAKQFASAAIRNLQAFGEYHLLAFLQGFESAYNAALIDFLTLPEITSVYTAMYKGNVGEVISIYPKQAHKITSIDVSIRDANGNVLESGEGVSCSSHWRYVTTVVNPNVKGSKLFMVSRDRQNQEFRLDVVLY